MFHVFLIALCSAIHSSLKYLNHFVVFNDAQGYYDIEVLMHVKNTGYSGLELNHYSFIGIQILIFKYCTSYVLQRA